MNLEIAVRQSVRYLFPEGAIVGSFKNTIRWNQPRHDAGSFIADLHCHPYIATLEDLMDTIQVCRINNVSLIANVQHYPPAPNQKDYWETLEIARRGLNPMDEDSLSFTTINVWFIGGYEIPTRVKGVSGSVDIVALIPEKGLRENLGRFGDSIDEVIKLCRDYGAIIIGTHPYTIYDPWSPLFFTKSILGERLFNKLKNSRFYERTKMPYRLASEEERKRIIEGVFTKVDVIDLVSTNTLWMLESNRLAYEDYEKHFHRKPLFNSDAHSKNKAMRREIGRAGNIFRFNLDGDLKQGLHQDIISNRFRQYRGYMPLRQFIFSIALD